MPEVTAFSIGANNLSRADAEADLDFLVRAIESVHPNPYLLRSREDFQADRERLRASIPDSIEQVDWCLRLSVLIATLEDGHTAVTCGLQVQVQLALQTNPADLFPLELALDREQHLVVTDVRIPTDEIARGDRLLRVNERQADDLLTELTREISGDTLASRRAHAASDFSQRLAYHAIGPPYSVTVLTADGAERHVQLPPLTAAPVPGTATPAGAEEHQAFSYRTLAAGIGYVDFYSMTADRGRFEKDTRALFKQMARDSVGTLIVDLRKNRGGDVTLGTTFLSHLTEKPFRTHSRLDIKRSKELRDWGKSHVRAPFRWLQLQFLTRHGRALYRGPLGSSAVLEELPVAEHRKAKPSFRGNVCFLTGPGTLSAAALLADAVKTYGLGTIVGAPTGGRPNTGAYVTILAGEPFTVRLPRSTSILSVPGIYSTRANGDRTDLAPVLPDISIEATAADIRAGRDPVLERALSCGR
jgi:hypothetical protein